MSLAEVIVGVLLISIFAVVLLGIVPAAVFGVRSELRRLTAVSIAHSLLDDLASTGFEKLSTGVQREPDQTRQDVVYRTVYGIYDTGWKGDPQIFETTHNWTPATTTYRVDVEVTWNYRNKPLRHFTSTVLGRT